MAEASYFYKIFKFIHDLKRKAITPLSITFSFPVRGIGLYLFTRRCHLLTYLGILFYL